MPIDNDHRGPARPPRRRQYPMNNGDNRNQNKMRGKKKAQGGRQQGKSQQRGRRPMNMPQPQRPPIEISDAEIEEMMQTTGGPEVAIGDLKAMSMQELLDLARELNIEECSGLKKQDLIFKVLQASILKT